MSTNRVTTVTSQTNPLAYMKAIATLVGTIATGLLTEFGPGGTLGVWLTVVVVVATAITTWVVPNALVVPAVTDEGEVVGDEETDDGLTYEESGGLPFPTDADESALYGDGADRGSDHDDYGSGNPGRY